LKKKSWETSHADQQKREGKIRKVPANYKQQDGSKENPEKSSKVNKTKKNVILKNFFNVM